MNNLIIICVMHMYLIYKPFCDQIISNIKATESTLRNVSCSRLGICIVHKGCHVLCTQHCFPVYSRGYIGSNDEERIECRASSTSITQLSSAYDAITNQLQTIVIANSSDVSGIRICILNYFHNAVDVEYKNVS